MVSDAEPPQDKVEGVMCPVSQPIGRQNEENKENKTPASVRIEIADSVKAEKVDNKAFLRPKTRSDKSEPFVMPQVRPQTMLTNNRMSKFGRVTKFKHMKGTPMHKSMHFENLKNLSKSVPADCDFIQVNSERVVVPLAGRVTTF